ncbi:MAG: hypothetical protein JW753_01200 [Dehalococcoidia bacterium]|nr:hypothetical protein [Dehalococcoidia bacterium]
MQDISARKKLRVIRYYLRGDSYDTIAVRTGVSKGSVAAIVADFKAGRIPEVQEPTDLIDLLRELAVDCRKANTTPEQVVVGLAMLSRLQELQIEPTEIDRWAGVYRQLGDDQSALQVFIRTALLLDEIRAGSGLTLEGLEARAKELREEVARLEPKVRQLRQCEKTLQDMEKQKKTATMEVTRLGKHRDDLHHEVTQKERREAELTRRVGVLEQRAESADSRLAAARDGLGLLGKLGLSPEGLAGFAQRVAGLAQRHGIKPEALRDRLLCELERLDKCLTLDALTKARKADLASVEGEVAAAREEREEGLSAVLELRLEKAKLGKAVQDVTALFHQEIETMTNTVRNAAKEISEGLSTDMANASAEVVKLTNMAIDLGHDFGRYEGIANANEWARVFSSIMLGKGDITAVQLRVAGLTVLRAISDWPQRSGTQSPLPEELRASLGSAIKEVEQWRP